LLEEALAEDPTVRREPPRQGSIELAHVSVHYRLRSGRDSITGLDGVSFHVPAGRFVSVVGPSGCGKTTLLKVIAGLLAPTSGTVRIDGAPIESGKAMLGLMFQKPLLFPWRTALGNVLLPLDVARRRSPEGIARARQLLALVDLSPFADAYPHELSAGMQQRVALARTLVRNPPVLLMDEPFAALDELTREAMNAELLRIWEESRKTVLFVTHNVAEAIFLSDAIIVMGRAGRIERTLPVDLPRPRQTTMLGSESFLHAFRNVRKALRLDR